MSFKFTLLLLYIILDKQAKVENIYDEKLWNTAYKAKINIYKIVTF